MKKRALSLLLVLSLLAALIGCGTQKRPGRAKQAPEGPQSREVNPLRQPRWMRASIPGSPTRRKKLWSWGF